LKTIRYAVLSIGAEWRIVTDRHHIGHFASRARAFETALRIAQEASRSGHRAEILYADQGGELHSLSLPTLVPPASEPAEVVTLAPAARPEAAWPSAPEQQAIA